MTSATDILKSYGLKVTTQRLAIFNFLLSTTEHPDTETIYNNLKEAYPTMSLATVYKNLASLCEAGLVQELHIGDSSCHYDAVTVTHHHLICTDCGKILDYFSNSTLSELKEKIHTDTSFTINNEKLYFYGICSACNEK